MREKQQNGPLSIQAVRYSRVLKWEDEPVLKLTLDRPRLPEETRGARRINRYYMQVAEQWRTRWEHELYQDACNAAGFARENGRPFQPWEAQLGYTVTLNQNGLFSTYLDAYEYAGGAHGDTVRLGDTWAVRCGVPRTMRSFFPPKFNWKQQVLNELERQAAQRIGEGETLYFQDWNALLHTYFDPDQFYLTEEGICIFYPLYTIAPYAEGIPVFLIPYPADALGGAKDTCTKDTP